MTDETNAPPERGWLATVPWVGPYETVYGSTKMEAVRNAEANRSQHMAALQSKLTVAPANQHDDLLEQMVRLRMHMIEAHQMEEPSS